MWMHENPKAIDYGYTGLIMNIRDSIVVIHDSVMDIHNLKFTIVSIVQSWLPIIQNHGILKCI